MSMEHFNFLLAEFEPPPPESGNEVGNITLKAEDEIQRFSVDESLSDTERAAKFLSGHEMQQRVAIEYLPDLIERHGRDAFVAIQQPLKSALSSVDTDGKVEIVNALATICRERFLTGADQAELILPMVVKNLRAKDPPAESHDAWLTCLNTMAPNLQPGVLAKDLAELAAAKSDVSQPVHARVTSCRILGAIAPGLGREALRSRYYRRAIEMCQDTDYQVRIAMCQELPVLASVIGREETQGTVLGEVFELLNDEEVKVRNAAMACLMQLFDLLPAEACKDSIAPKFIEFCTRQESDLKLSPGLARFMGPLITRLEPFMYTSHDLDACVQCFCRMASADEDCIRRDCANNFPAVLKVLGAKRYSSVLHNTFVLLAADRDNRTRVKIAAQFHEVCKMLGRDRCLQFLKLPLMRFIKDDCVEVKQTLCAKLDITLGCFAGSPEQQEECRTNGSAFFSDISQQLREMEHGIGRNWRLQLMLVTVMAGFPSFFTPDQIRDVFMPIVLNGLQNGVPKVRSAAADTAVAFFRSYRRTSQKVEAYSLFLRDFARHRSFWHRITFIEIAHSVIRRFSAAFFKLYFFDPVIDLLHDRVPNVRSELCRILPVVKSLIRLPEDVDKLERVNNAVANLIGDDDRVVAETARSLHDAFKRTPVRMGGSATINMNGTSGDSANFDELEQVKEDEEAEMCIPREDFERIKNEELVAERKKKAATSTAWPSMSGNRRTLGAGKSSEPRAVPRRISADDCSPSGTLSSSAAPSASSRTASGGLQPGNAAPKRGTGSSRPGAASSQHGNSRISKMSPTGSSASASGSSMQRRTFSQDGPPSGRQAGTGGGRLARLTEGSKMSQQNSPKGSTSPTKASIRQSAMASGAKSATASRRTTTSNR